MTIENLNVESSIERVKALLKEEKNISPALHSAIELLLIVVTLLFNRLSLDSRNSSKPPSQVPNREKEKKRTGKKPGGQNGHKGKTLVKVSELDETIERKVEHCSQCSKNIESQKAEGYETRQVFDIEIKKIVVSKVDSTSTLSIMPITSHSKNNSLLGITDKTLFVIC